VPLRLVGVLLSKCILYLLFIDIDICKCVHLTMKFNSIQDWIADLAKIMWNVSTEDKQNVRIFCIKLFTEYMWARIMYSNNYCTITIIDLTYFENVLINSSESCESYGMSIESPSIDEMKSLILAPVTETNCCWELKSKWLVVWLIKNLRIMLISDTRASLDNVFIIV